MLVHERLLGLLSRLAQERYGEAVGEKVYSMAEVRDQAGTASVRKAGERAEEVG
jgi:hypothetical protein